MKRKGVISLECAVSMAILSLIVYLIGFSLNNSAILLCKNEQRSKLLNLAQNYMNQAKYDIKNNEGCEENSTISIEDVVLNKSVSKAENYYNCYLISIEAKSEEGSVELNSYVTKE